MGWWRGGGGGGQKSVKSIVTATVCSSGMYFLKKLNKEKQLRDRTFRRNASRQSVYQVLVNERAHATTPAPTLPFSREYTHVGDAAPGTTSRLLPRRQRPGKSAAANSPRLQRTETRRTKTPRRVIHDINVNVLSNKPFNGKNPVQRSKKHHAGQLAPPGQSAENGNRNRITVVIL